MERLTPAHARYLLAIYDLARAMPDVSTVELAKALGVTKPSVTRMSAMFDGEGIPGAQAVREALPHGHGLSAGEGDGSAEGMTPFLASANAAK